MSVRALFVAGLLSGGLICCSLGSASAQAGDPAQFQESIAEEAPEEDETSLAVNAGAVVATGNTRAWTLTAGAKFSLIRGRHGVGAEWAFNYGRADTTPLTDDTEFENTVRNSNARLRYDFYLTQMDALFVAFSHRWDTFAGLDMRLQTQVGYLRNFIRKDKHRFWGEIGYDLTFDDFDPDPLLDEMGNELDGTAIVHAGRFYLGYRNELNDYIRIITGAELLLNFEEIEDVRLAWDVALNSTIAEDLQIAVAFKLLFDNVPVPGATEVDTNTTITLVYSFL